MALSAVSQHLKPLNRALQRTRRPRFRTGRSLRSLGSPLKRYPLGASAISRLAIVLVGGACLTGCSTTAASFTPFQSQLSDLHPARAVTVSVSPVNGADELAIRERLLRALRQLMPEVAIVADKAQVDLELEFQRDDTILCIDCGQLEYKTQYWHWSLNIMKPEFDPKCDAFVSRPVGSLYGETWKLSERAEVAAVRELRKIFERARASAPNKSLHRTPAAALSSVHRGVGPAQVSSKPSGPGIFSSP